MSKYFDNKDSFMGPKTTQYGSHMVMTNVVKETRKKYINIDSRFHDEYMNGDAAAYTITLPERINDVKSLCVCNAEIPMSIYNVSADLGNNCFKVTTDGTSPIIVTIPDGNYNATTLKTAINNELSETTLICSIDDNKITFTATATATTTIDFAIDGTGAYDKYNFKGKFGWMVGYRDVSIELATGSSATGSAFVNLQSPRYLYLVVDEFTRGNQNSFMSPLAASFINKNILARIVLDSVNYPYGSILTANVFNGHLLSDVRSYTGKVDLQRLSVQLVNEYGVPVNLNGLDFSFCLEVQYE
uniref:Uncharacterized protein n=1 Tax=viral metagenome TaxID=1070528 RepID=A0A6C0KIH5_9ZZZZ